MDEKTDTESGRAGEQSGVPAVPESVDTPLEIEGEEHFEAVIEEHDLVLAFFYGEWCDYCDLVQPVVEEIAENTWFTVVSIDVEANEAFAKSHDVDELPTFLFIKEGELEGRAQGAHDREWFEDWLPLGY